MIEVELKEWGNSYGVILPIEKLREMGVKKGDRLAIDIVKKERIDGFGMCKGAGHLEHEKDHEFQSLKRRK
jgi:hypothetical protein